MDEVMAAFDLTTLGANVNTSLIVAAAICLAVAAYVLYSGITKHAGRASR